MPKGNCMDCKEEIEVAEEGSTGLCPKCFEIRTGVAPEQVKLGVDETQEVKLLARVATSLEKPDE